MLSKNRVMKRIIIRIIAGIFIFSFVVLTCLYFYGFYLPDINRYFAKREEAAIMSKMAQEKRAFLELHQKDVEGGTTPEETFDLLISALKAGNIDLASKYYVPIYQEGAKEGFEEEIKNNGGLQNSIKYFVEVRTMGEKSCSNLKGELGGCMFEYIYTLEKDEISFVSGRPEKLLFPKGSKASESVGFWLNPYTKKWKISDQP